MSRSSGHAPTRSSGHVRDTGGTGQERHNMHMQMHTCNACVTRHSPHAVGPQPGSPPRHSDFAHLLHALHCLPTRAQSLSVLSLHCLLTLTPTYTNSDTVPHPT